MLKNEKYVVVGVKEMSGYSISLYKFMRIDEKLQKKKELMENRTHVLNTEKTGNHIKFLAYGEFDRISFDRIERFSKFRDISEKARVWVGDRQTHLVYDIIKAECEDEIYYEDGNFYERSNGKAAQSGRLFVGITILQFKYSEKERCTDMGAYLGVCKEQIVNLVKKSGYDVKCAVLGTLGSFGLTIIWLADQYIDVLRLVTKIRNTDIGREDGSEKSIFLSAYTIFAQNHEYGEDWKRRVSDINGKSVLHLTLKRGLDKEIKDQLSKWKISDSSIYHSAGEHDVIIRMESSDAFQIFEKGKDLNYNSLFFKKCVLQSNVQLCENELQMKEYEVVHNSIDTEDISDESISKGQNGDVQVVKKALPELEQIQDAYKELREKFAQMFPSTVGMVDTLDLLYSDYISKVSTASNEMWVDNFSHQFLRVLMCINEFSYNMESLNLTREKVLKTINDLLSDFERQISHIAESNNLVFGTPICQFRYSGQNNLTLYAYFGIIKNILSYVYEEQEVNTQDEIIPLIVADIVPIIQSDLYIDYKRDKYESEHGEKIGIYNASKIVTINLPMVSLYNPVCYYPYLYHEIFHYVVPRDRYVRNQILGCLISIKILYASMKTYILHGRELESIEEKELLDRFIEVQFLRYVYNFVIENYVDYIGIVIENLSIKESTYQEVNEKILTASAFEKKMFLKWVDWLGKDEDAVLKNNPLYLCVCYLYEQRKNILNDFSYWKKTYSGRKGIDDVEKKITEFTEKLGGVADNIEPKAAKENFQELTYMLNDEVLDEAIILIDGIKEAMADIAMVAICDMDFSEYLLLFTKTKKDLLISWNHENIELQDIIRIGMVLDFLWGDKIGDGIFMETLDRVKEDYINMYCGLYFSSHRENEKGYWNDLFEEAENWFLYWKNCYRAYCGKYRIYAMLMRELKNRLLVSAEDKSQLQRLKENDSKYWKAYAVALRDYGNYMRVKREKEGLAHWQEMRTSIDRRMFELNIQLIYSYQHQDNFITLNKKRENRIENMKERKYNGEGFRFEIAKLPEMKGSVSVKGLGKYYWEYCVDSIGQLSTLVADIAEQLKFSSSKILGQNDYPIWYRGHQSEEYKLIPSIMRNYKEKKAKVKDASSFCLSRLLRKEFEEFKFRADGTTEAIDRTGYTESDYIALMQHYSVASNFLDWTEDALSALYFALEGFLDKKADKPNKDAALYIFSPALYNYARRKIILNEGKIDDHRQNIEDMVVEKTTQEGIPNLTVSYNAERYFMYLLGKEKYGGINRTPFQTEEMMKEKRKYYLPLAIYVSRLNKRIQAQSGIFLAYNIYTSPDKKDSFDYISLEEIQKSYLEDYKSDRETCPFLFKIRIKESEREQVAAWVKAFGMSKEKCYPELSNIGERIV